MELKAVKEYKTPEYSTMDESKNKVLGFIMNCKKISVGVLVMLLTCNKAFAGMPITAVGGVEVMPGFRESQIVDFIVAMFQLISYLMSIILIVYTGIIVIKNRKQEDEEKKLKIKKRGIICIIVAILLPILSTLINIIVNSLYY